MEFDGALLVLQCPEAGMNPTISTPRKVHITTADGELLYTRLWDDGSDTLRFDAFGSVDRWTIKREAWQIRPGWPLTQADRKARGFALAEPLPSKANTTDEAKAA